MGARANLRTSLLISVFLLAMVGTAAQAVVIDWVTVGDAGNTADTEVMNDGTTGYGSVSYVYRIGKYEVTNSQYCEFLNAVARTDTYGLYNPNMAHCEWDSGGIARGGSPGTYTYSVRPGRGNNPVNYVSWYDSLRFANWLHNGQPTGGQNSSTTEDGAYTFSGAESVSERNAVAQVFVPSEDEWYKAAYYKGGGADAGYWDYATQSDTPPSLEAPPGGNNSANAGPAPAGGHGLTDVGAYVASVSAYGTYDQNGNLTEWNETRFGPEQWCLRGGAWDMTPIAMAAYLRDRNNPAYLENWNFGFRVASVPKPPTMYYVDAVAPTGGDGSSWAKAFRCLQEALAVAENGDEIRVAQGAYTPEGPLPDIRQASNPNPDNGAISVSRTADLSWTAGSGATSHDVYFGTNSPPPFVCNQTATTFDPGTMAYYTTYYWRIDELNQGGKTTGTVWSFTTAGSGPSSPTPPPDLSVPPPPLDRTATFQLKNGVVIKGGYVGFGEADPNARDIDVYKTILSGDLLGNDGPDFANNGENSYHVITGSGTDETAVLDGFTITAGHANGSNPEDRGAGMTNDSGGPTLTNCTFVRNWAHYAAGIANKNGSNPTLTNCTFRDNLVVASGGAVYNWNHSNSTLTNCTFSGNSAPDGAAMFIYNSRPTLTNCLFGGNSSQYNGGALYLRLSSPTLTNCTFTGNSAGGDGGGMYNEDSSPTVTNCTFSKNSAAFGGGICNWLGSPTLVNCKFTANSADCGGGLWNDNCDAMLSNCLFSGNSAVRHGGGICRAGGSRSPTLANCTFSANSAGKNGGGICNWDTGDKATLYNCILWGNTDQSGMNEESQIDFGILDYCCVQGWTGNLGGTGNIDADPCFVVPGYLTPISYWKLDEVDGTTAYDSVGENHGTVYGAQWTTGQVGGALSFDGVDDYAGIAWDESLANVADNFTILLWAQPLSTHQIDPESNSGTSGTRGQKYAISARHGDYHWGSGHAGAGISIGTNGISVYEHAADYMPAVLVWSGSVSGFTHVAVVYSDKQPRLYIDGESKKTGLQSSKTVHILSNIGGHRYGYFNGLIDDVHIYDRALSAEEIQQHYLSGLNGQGYPDANTPDYHLLPGSPCINAGDPDYIAEPDETDLDGKPRVIAGRIDMGAYEFNHVPVADAGPDRTVEAQGHWGATVTLDGSGSSDADSTPGTSDDINDFNWYEFDPCDPNADVFLGSGRIIDCNLSIGEHIILLEVMDKAGALDVDEITIIIQDTTPPDINCPPNVILECPADTTPSATGKATATDTCGNVTIIHSDLWQVGCGHASTLHRTWRATDECGNSSSCVQIITVVDTTPPVITCFPDVTLQCPADTSVEANGSATAVDTCSSVAIAHSDLWQPNCGNAGTLVRTWTATDECGNSSSCVQMLTVVDTTPPEFEFSVTPTMLWPPNHKMVKITPSWTVSDECDTSPDVSLVSILANEGDDIIGDGHTSGDIQIDDDGSIFVRSERSGPGTGRIYTITYQAVDDCGNATVRSAAVSIPHDFRVLARIASRWLWTNRAGNLPEDLNGDGIVNLKDFAKFAENYWTGASFP